MSAAHATIDVLRRTTQLGHGTPAVCRLGLATRGDSELRAKDVEWALDRGVNYFNWCGRDDGLSDAVRRLGERRSEIVVTAQFEARRASDAAHEFESMLDALGTSYIDILTLYYVESPGEWKEIIAPGGVWEFLDQQKRLGRLSMIGLTTHQRPLAAEWAHSGRLDMLMVRYNAAHRGAEREVFPVAADLGIPVVTFTGLRWRALLSGTPDDPPAFQPPAAADCYRFCLANPQVAVALAAPGSRAELEHALTLLENWRPPDVEEYERLRDHGDRVRKHAGTFW